MPLRRSLLALFLVGLLVGHGPLSSAPIASESDGPAAAVGTSTLGPAAGAAPSTTRPPLEIATSSGADTRTVELLLDAKGLDAAPAAGSDPAKPRLSPEAARIAAKVLTPALPGGGELSNSPRRAQPGDPDWVPAKPLPIANPFGRDEFRERPRAGERDFAEADAPEDDVRLLPKALVRFVKQNRELVIVGSVVALILGFVFAAFQRR
jgi:hypothetical protein